MAVRKSEKEKSIERRGAEKAEIQTEKLRLKRAGEIQKEAVSVIEVAEAKEGAEGTVEFAEGKIAEEISEDKKRAPVTGLGGALTADEIEVIRAKLLANLPPQEVMVKQIRRKLETREKQLRKDYKKFKKMGHKAAFQLTKIVASIRKIQEYFLVLAHATFDVVKQLWLKIVHGV